MKPRRLCAIVATDDASWRRRLDAVAQLAKAGLKKKGIRMRGLGADEEYWKGLAEGVLKVQQCTNCDRWHVPAVWRCGECSSWDLAWRTVDPTGSVYSWTRTWHQFGAPSELGLPILIAMVELHGAGRRRLMGTIADSSADIRIGQQVTGEVIQTSLGGEVIPALRWKLTGDVATATTAAGDRSS